MLSTTNSSSFQELFDKISSFCEQHELVSEQLLQAKDEFFFLTGKLKEDEQDFANRINAFLLWFLFDRRPRDLTFSPLLFYKLQLEKEGNKAEIALLNEQVAHIHSIFQFIRIKGGQTVIKDIVTGKKHLIHDENFLIGVTKGVYFETRLLYFEGHLCFANYFIRHPAAVKKGIRKKIKAIRGDRKALKKFFLKLHSYNTKWNKYRNINVHNIYHFDQSIPEAK